MSKGTMIPIIIALLLCVPGSSSFPAGGVTYSSTSGGTLGLLITDSSSIPNSAACPTRASYFGDITKKGGINPMSVTDDTENCDSLRFKIWDYPGPGQTQQAYDTTKKFSET